LTLLSGQLVWDEASPPDVWRASGKKIVNVVPRFNSLSTSILPLRFLQSNFSAAQNN
jgi:hypothetical protein